MDAGIGLGRRCFLVQIFPVVVIQNELFEVKQENGKIELTQKDHLISELNRYTADAETILIDIVKESYFDNFWNS